MHSISRCFKCKAQTDKSSVPTIDGDIIYISKDEYVYLHKDIENIKTLVKLLKVEYNENEKYTRKANENFCFKLTANGQQILPKINSICGDFFYVVGDPYVYHHIGYEKTNKIFAALKKVDFN